MASSHRSASGGINTTPQLKDIETCAHYHAANVAMPEGTLNFYFGSEARQAGMRWRFPRETGRRISG